MSSVKERLGMGATEAMEAATATRQALATTSHALQPAEVADAIVEAHNMRLAALADTRESPQAKLAALLAQPAPPEWRMDAYYFGFFGTGILAVDRILSAVACAGKAYHHTDSWMNDCEPYPHLRGGSPVEWIRNAAHDLAALLRRCCDHDVDGNCDRHPTKEPDRG